MSLDLVPERKSHVSRPTWSGAAFIVGALLLLVFVATSSAIFVQLFAFATGQATDSVELSQAVAAAQNVAERFAADPESIDRTTQFDNLVVASDIDDEKREHGTFYTATISVYKSDVAANAEGSPSGEPIYSISTARYVEGEGE
ncbi:MAG: hypothetical protein IJH04_09155 [Eggerthellaceae bacterium]|nr:hypothetical protein [Eggerthellaceae bacterium]